MKRPAGVVASAVILALLSLFQIAMALMMALAGSLGNKPDLAAARPGAPPPPWMPLFLYALGIFFLALAAWGIATAIGLHRLRRWARYSILVIGGCMAGLGFVSFLTMLLMIPLATAAAISAEPGRAGVPAARITVEVVFGVIALLYALVASIGIWWLVYFNRKAVRAVFAGPSGELAESRRPLLISAIAVILAIGAVSCALLAFLPLPGAFLGWVLRGWEKTAFYAIYAALEAAAAYGLWRLKEGGRQLALGLQAFGIVQMMVYVLRPATILRLTAEANRAMAVRQPAMAEHAQRMFYIPIFSLSILMLLAIAYVLHHYRRSFAEPARPAIGQPTAPA